VTGSPVQGDVHQDLVEGPVEERREMVTTGCRLAIAIPAAEVIACCSAMPTSNNRSG